LTRKILLRIIRLVGVIVRPQVIHVARPILVDRPVPVTQRPIIIDRERPVPVPARGNSQGGSQSGGSRIVREEYVYQDNNSAPSAGTNYGQMAASQEHSYGGNSAHEESAGYQMSGDAINVSQGAGAFQESYSDTVRVNNASAAMPSGLLSSGGPIEVLDSTVNSSWQKTDPSALVNRYGRPAFDIVQQTNQVEQQMYRELRQRTISGGVQRSGSAASFGSGPGIGIGPRGASFSSIPFDNMNNFNQHGHSRQGPTSNSSRINY
jgi:hypothetical protein